MTTRILPAAGLLAAGLLGGVVVASVTTATAQSPTPTPSVGPDLRDEKRALLGKAHGFKHGRGLPPGALHGEFTTRAPGGTGFQTMAMQNGEVTAVSATSITVKSEDGFSRTYAVNDDTLVKAGDEGIADVSTGDEVHVLAIVEGGNARAVRVHDGSKLKALREKWRPAPSRT